MKHRPFIRLSVGKVINGIAANLSCSRVGGGLSFYTECRVISCSACVVWEGSGLQLGGHFGHGAVLRADVCADAYGSAVGLGDALAGQYAGYEGASERVAGAYGVGHGDFWRLLERDGPGCEDVGAVGAAGEHEHVEVVLAQDEPALVLDVEAWIAEHAADEHEFLVVDLEDVAAAYALLDDLLGVELLAQVDVEDLEAVVGRSVEELLDGGAAYDVALCERAKAYGTARACDGGDIVVEGNVVPSHVLLDVVRGDTAFGQRHLHGARGVGHAGQQVVEVVLTQGFDGLVGQAVLAESADGDGVVRTEELTSVVSEVGRCATEFLAFGQHVPQDFAQAYDITFFVHSLMQF